MSYSKPQFSQIRKIDNSRQYLPIITTLLLIFLIVLAVWFFRGGSFKLYASVFFTLYNLTHQVWISVLLIGILQNIIFLPLRITGMLLEDTLKDFEDKLDTVKNQNDQYFLLNKKIKEGNIAVVFYIFNFFVNAIAFFSAGRIFLIDFYSVPIDRNYLYSFVPYPDYPLQGTDFRFPFFKITETMAINWSTIFLIIFGIILLFSLFRLIWRLVRFALWRSKTILNARIGYNRLLLKFSGVGGTIIILLMIFLRHIPTSWEGIILSVDLTRQNTPMNFFTATITFITVLWAGLKHNLNASKEAEKAGIPELVIKSVFRDKMRQSFKNSLVLGLGAFFVTNQIPSAFELSVATFEFMYIISPFTFDLMLPKKRQPVVESVAAS